MHIGGDKILQYDNHSAVPIWYNVNSYLFSLCFKWYRDGAEWYKIVQVTLLRTLAYSPQSWMH